MNKLSVAPFKWNKIVNFFDSTYTNIKDNNYLLTRMKLYSFLRLIVRWTANLIIPIYYNITFNIRDAKLDFVKTTSPKLIVSLTTFPLRINKIWIVIESIFRQNYKPDKIILWLSKEQFSSIDVLPKKLIRQQKKGLEIHFCEEDIKSHKKYFYMIKNYPNDLFLTIDDDIIYPTTLISQLIELNNLYPTAICCHRALQIQSINGKILPYTEWKILTKQKGPSLNIFFTSGGGTLFPPNLLHKEVLNDIIIKKYCFSADDVWLNCMSQLNDTMIVKSNYYSALLPVIIRKNKKLATINTYGNMNNVYINDLRTYYNTIYQLDHVKLFMRK